MKFIDDGQIDVQILSISIECQRPSWKSHLNDFLHFQVFNNRMAVCIAFSFALQSHYTQSIRIMISRKQKHHFEFIYHAIKLQSQKFHFLLYFRSDFISLVCVCVNVVFFSHFTSKVFRFWLKYKHFVFLKCVCVTSVVQILEL